LLGVLDIPFKILIIAVGLQFRAYLKEKVTYKGILRVKSEKPMVIG
jgi:hypothetical protein